MIRTVLAMLVGLIVALAGVLLFAWLLWWLWTRRDKEKERTAIEIEAEPLPTAPEPAAVEPEAMVPAATVEAEAEVRVPQKVAVPDDLQRIEGIGPKIAALLHGAGITTYAQLADADLSHLEQILGEADPRLVRLSTPANWREQAALAAAGEWEALEALKGELKGGRRV